MNRGNKDNSGSKGAGIRLSHLNIIMICIGLVLATLMGVSMYRTQTSVGEIVTVTNDFLTNQQTGGMLREIASGLGEQAMAEMYLEKIPGLNFLYYEIAAAIQTGAARMENIENAESLCIDKLICMLWMRREEAKTAEETAALDAQAHTLLDLFKSCPMYRRTAEIMEQLWNDGTIMGIYQ